MMDIERLFEGDRPVPGMRPSARVVPTRMELRTGTDAQDGDPHAQRASNDEIDTDTVETVPEFPVALVEPLKPGPQLRSAHDPAHAHSERIRLLRTEILLRHSVQHGSMAFAVVGAGEGDGRSQLSAELAMAFAQLGRSTLLLDADMRRPRQHELFGATLHDGLSQAIVRGDSPTLYSVEGYPYLSLMTAGISPPNPIELLSDGRFEWLMQRLRSTFEFIVVDTPSCSKFADGLVVATVVGHVLVVYRARHTPFKAVRAMLRQLNSARAQILGGALNHF